MNMFSTIVLKGQVLEKFFSISHEIFFISRETFFISIEYFLFLGKYFLFSGSIFYFSGHAFLFLGKRFSVSWEIVFNSRKHFLEKYLVFMFSEGRFGDM